MFANEDFGLIVIRDRRLDGLDIFDISTVIPFFFTMAPGGSSFGTLLKHQNDPSGRFTRSKLICNGGMIPLHSVIIEALCPAIQKYSPERCQTNGLDFTVKFEEFLLPDVAKAVLLLYSGVVDSRGLHLSLCGSSLKIPDSVLMILHELGVQVVEDEDDSGMKIHPECRKSPVGEVENLPNLKVHVEVRGMMSVAFVGFNGNVKYLKGSNDDDGLLCMEALRL